MNRPVTCRHCGAGFEPRPGKPGFIDECPECLEERKPQPVALAPSATPMPRTASKKPCRYTTPEALNRTINRDLVGLIDLVERLDGKPDPFLRGIATKLNHQGVEGFNKRRTR
jgi:hypothetical protein